MVLLSWMGVVRRGTREEDGQMVMVVQCRVDRRLRIANCGLQLALELHRGETTLAAETMHCDATSCDVSSSTMSHGSEGWFHAK